MRALLLVVLALHGCAAGPALLVATTATDFAVYVSTAYPPTRDWSDGGRALNRELNAKEQAEYASCLATPPAQRVIRDFCPSPFRWLPD